MSHKINKVGLGTFPLAGVFNKINTKKAEYLVSKFLNEGGYYIDTAPLYGNGEIEKLIGKALKGVPRDKFYLITKTVKVVNNKGAFFKSGKEEDVIAGLQWSLKRLGLDYVDQLMVHSPDESVPIRETLGAMEELQKQGKAKDLSVSNVNLEELKEYNQSGKIKYVQNRFSLINRSVADLEDYLLKHNIKLIPYHLLEIGMLTNSVLNGHKMRKGDLREQLSYWSDENQRVIFDWIKTSLAPMAMELGITIEQLNIAWALKQKYIDFVIVGTTKPDYLSVNLKANDIDLTDKILDKINKAYVDFENMIRNDYGKSVREFRGLNEKYY